VSTRLSEAARTNAIRRVDAGTHHFLSGEVGRKGAAAREAKRRRDPEFAARLSANSRRSGRVGGPVGGPKGLETTNTRRVRCAECGLTSTPGGVGVHQAASGHRGRKELSS